MSAPVPGDRAPEFCLPDAEEDTVCLGEFAGTWLVLYFYPKDNTSGCTLEAVDFSSRMDDVRAMGAEVVGVSPDSPKSHCRFRDNHDLKVRLLSDESHSVLEKYGVWKLKKMYGREYYGVERSTFLIAPDGAIAAAWRKVRVKGHVDEVLNTLVEKQTGADG